MDFHDLNNHDMKAAPELGNIYVNPTDEIISDFQSHNEVRLKPMEENT